MYKLRFTVPALLIGLLGASLASAQTAQNITILSGNGQVECPTCFSSLLPFFLPMVLKVTDAGGRPIPNKTVNWVVTSSFGQVASLNLGPTTVTDANGITSNTVNQSSLPGSGLQGFLQTTVTASADNANVSFTETQALTDSTNHFKQFVLAAVTSPAQGTILTGNAGGPANAPIQVHVDASGKPVVGVSVRLVSSNDPAAGPSAACGTGPGADPGSVLTDANGNAICTPIFGPLTGNSSFTVLIGGAVDASPTATQPVSPVGYQSVGGFIQFQVTAPTAGSISISSGAGQSAGPGQTLTNPLQVRVADITGTTPIPTAAVTWSVSPAGSASFNPITSSTNAQGLAFTTVTLATSASGTLTVTAALTGANSNISTTFQITVVAPPIPVTSIQKLSGDAQTATVGVNFAQPLAVQVNTAAGTATNYPVTFTVSGPGTIGGRTSTVANTDSNGKAQVTLTAGATIGSITVMASGGGQSATFSETVVPPGPNLTANSFYNAAGLKQGSLSPCGLATIIATGVAPGVSGTVVPVSPVGALPLTLGPTSVTFNGVSAPISSVTNSGGQESVTLQVPCEVTPGSSVPVTVNAAGGTASVNVAVQIASPGIYETPMSDGVRRAVMIRADGSFVSLENPARRGEIIRVYVTGLGATAPSVGTNSIAIPVTDSLVLGQVIVGVNNSGARVVSARMAPTEVGIYEVAFQVDPNAPTGNNVVLSVAINPTDGSATQFSNGSKIPIQ